MTIQLDSYENEKFKNCIDASFANLHNIVFGLFMPDKDVQSFYRGTGLPGIERWWLSRVFPGQTYWRALQWVLLGMGDQAKPRCFGSVALNLPALKKAIADFKAVTVGVGGGHQVTIRVNESGVLEIVDSIAGLIEDPELAKYLPLLDSAMAFDFDKFNWSLVRDGMLIHWKLWSCYAVLSVIVALIARALVGG